MKFKRTTIKLKVKSILPIYTNSSNPEGITTHWVYNVIEAHAPGNLNMKYTIVDKQRLIKNQSVKELSIRSLTDAELTQLKLEPSTSSWYNPNIQVYKTQYPIDVKAYFSQCDWKNKLDLWITENLIKDPRLVVCFKAIVIPLQGDSTLIQPLNNHCVWLIITGTGKSFYAYLLGSVPIIDPSVAGAIGSYDQGKNGAIVKKGFLKGEGFPIILDEINTNDKPLIQKILTYLETGMVTRGLKHPITIEGTKTVIVNGNPSDNDLVSSFCLFIKTVCTGDHPQRVGRRFGFLLLGDNYKKVKGTPDTSVRNEVRCVIETTIHQYSKKIQRMISDNLDWIKKSEPDIEREIMEYAKAIPNQLASDFVKGQSYGCIKKLKTSAIRYIILEQLDKVPSDKVDFSDRERIFQRLLDINRDSWKKLASLDIPTEHADKKQYVKELKKKHPNLSYRDIANIVGVSHTTVSKWLKE